MQILSLFGALLQVAATPTAVPDAAPPPPAILEQAFVEGLPDPDRIEWMRGAFPGATEAQQVQWQSVEAWLDPCLDQGTRHVDAQLAELGIASRVSSEQTYFPLCAAVSALIPPVAARADWEAYRAANQRAKTLLDAYNDGAQAAVNTLGGWFARDLDEDSRAILLAAAKDQVARKSLSLARGIEQDEPLAAALGDRALLMMTRSDIASTELLKAQIARNGWPTIPSAGKAVSGAAWLMVQHADLDPAFQLEALRLMEPLAERGEINRQNHAYLHDRVMLKISGSQRFGTQFQGCEDGRRVLRPVEDADGLAARRAAYELPTMDEYRTMMDETFEPCPEESD